jgi:GNAT superfamily N-acetyltransferase
MVAGFLSDYFFCNETIASDNLLFVDRQHRGTLAAVRLLRAFRKWAAARGARELCLGISTVVDAERIGKLYERMGLSRVGAIYKQRLR